MDTARFSRRSFLQGGLGALTLAVTSKGLITTVWAAETAARKYGADSMPGGTVDDPLVFVSIAADGTVTIVAHRAEMGTGVRTSLPMVVADEMEARWDRVKVIQAPADEARYGNQNVDGSRSVRHFLMPMRRAGAAARQMLEAAAAARWAVPVAEVKAVQHEVLHLPSGRRLAYGELAADAARQPVPKGEALKLKERAEFRYIGKDKVRLVDLEAIGKGQATYGMDVRLPGMVYAVVARPPVVGGKLRRFDSSKALALPGVLKVVEIPPMQGAPAFQPLGGVAVVARNTWAARQGRDALEIEWDDGPNAGYDSTAYRQTLETAARQPGKTMRKQGDATQTWGRASEAERLAAEYYIPHLAHASMEPPVATVQIKAGKAEVWTSVQNPAAARDAVAARLKLEPADVKVNVLLLGGGFGRKSKPDFVDEAAIIARAMPEGTPVKLVWTREDDIHHDYLHTVSVERLEAVLDKNGQVQSWLHRSAAPTIASLFSEGAKGQQMFESAMSAINMPYRIPNVQVETAEVAAHARIGWFRSVANIPHAFAAQCFIDELAHKAGKDPRDFALDLIGPARRIDPGTLADTWNYSESPERYPYDTGRLRGVIEAACKGADWGRTLPKGHGLGLAFCYSFMSYTATVVEVAVDEKGGLRVVSVDMAMDCGPQINPERIRAQMEGGAIMGLSLALASEITFEKGRVKQSNFHDYEVLRHDASPRVIRTHLVNDDHALPPGGVGEPPVPPVAPALCNAIFAATGKRIRDLPVRRVA
ncbi:xanthine dehydrogenase family protein molybdopterin-binding subunit [Bordetella hinzii]|uniref:Xanthine dehydrogenase family protein molybdopterin-binding subunit n=1 Tax=Bordetella hinzii TaxID=103855 RepID=A0AAN1RTG6_9BORD|nr:molybdopterin cofactor-binding domain-containing protein [Bordetella hinzii]AKQ59002.1 Isoquinoline 1-oxidoreductase subunit beta [Bordetella hinzii]AZW15724.1 xanthine dehydrogenase family protein molybdopterin-binding subunit [Bordetella hinzii]MBZ0075704.1 xanthine dehydrogenase family protein molybdopterin-binding subunit [Bordetella hinzii]MBZ0078737.1 xanthine dehydrogenase family protein molybdopterin-binding subunit [Bordetella hinzii]MBZ0083637.1 xanthine dehydrogenase family prote